MLFFFGCFCCCCCCGFCFCCFFEKERDADGWIKISQTPKPTCQIPPLFGRNVLGSVPSTVLTNASRLRKRLSCLKMHDSCMRFRTARTTSDPDALGTLVWSSGVWQRADGTSSSTAQRKEDITGLFSTRAEHNTDTG